MANRSANHTIGKPKANITKTTSSKKKVSGSGKVETIKVKINKKTGKVSAKIVKTKGTKNKNAQKRNKLTYTTKVKKTVGKGKGAKTTTVKVKVSYDSKSKNKKSTVKAKIVKNTVSKKLTMTGKGKKARIKVTYNKKTKKVSAKILKATKIKVKKGQKAKVSKTIKLKLSKSKKAKTVKIKVTYDSKKGKKGKVTAKIVKNKKNKGDNKKAKIKKSKITWINRRKASVRKIKPKGLFTKHKYKQNKKGIKTLSKLESKLPQIMVKEFKKPPKVANPLGGERSVTNPSSQKKKSVKQNVKKAWADKNKKKGVHYGHKFNAPSRAAKLATLYNLKTKQKLQVQFNPTTVPYNAGATYAETVAPGMNYPLFQYVHGNTTKFEIELFYYDRPHTGQIDRARKFLFSLLPPQKNQKPGKKNKVKGAYAPARFRFVYGYFKRTLVLENLKVNDEWCDSQGRAIMTRFTLSVIQVGNS